MDTFPPPFVYVVRHPKGKTASAYLLSLAHLLLAARQHGRPCAARSVAIYRRRRGDQLAEVSRKQRPRIFACCIHIYFGMGPTTREAKLGALDSLLVLSK